MKIVPMLRVTAIKLSESIGCADDRKRIIPKDALRTSTHPIQIAVLT